MISQRHLSLEVKGKIAYLIIDSPPRNQMGIEFFKELSYLNGSVFPELKVKGMIIYGRGRHFSSGAEISQITSLCFDAKGIDVLYEHSSCFGALEGLGYPVIAAVRGCCLGSGLELALSCGYRIAAQRSIFSFPEVTFGLLPGCGGTVRLGEIVGTGTAIDLILSGRSLLAEDALEKGLVDIVVPASKLIETAESFIERL